MAELNNRTPFALMPPGTTRRRNLRFVAAILTGVALLALVDNLTTVTESEPQAAFVEGDSAPPPVTQSTPVATASDNGELKIVERGYTPIKDLVGDPLVSWGVIVENTSREMIGGGRVEFGAIDSHGESITFNGSHHGAPIPQLAPGQRVGIGDATYLSGDGVDKVTFTVTDVGWWQTGRTRFPLATVSISEIEGTWSGAGETESYWSSSGISFPVNKRGKLTLTFRIESAYKRILTEPGGAVIFRDRDGHIVGAAAASNSPGLYDVPPGWSIRSMLIKYGPPESADGGSIEIYVYP